MRIRMDPNPQPRAYTDTFETYRGLYFTFYLPLPQCGGRGAITIFAENGDKCNDKIKFNIFTLL